MIRLVSRYFWWTEERGSLHYDVMVTAILIFIFFSPHFIDYKDRPVTTVATHASEVLVREAGSVNGNSRFMYQVRTEDMHGGSSDSAIQTDLLNAIEPISGEVSLERYEPVTDATGHIIAYNAWVVR
jgi:hypothetical protein